MILIKDITIITQNFNRQIIKNGGLVIEKDIIKAIGKSKDIEKEYSQKANKIIDGKNKIVMPGLINAHTHLAMTLLRGYADDLSLEDWWFKYIYPKEMKFGKKEVYWGSLLAMIEMIKTGTTCFKDFYYYEDEVDKAAQKIGMRGILGCAILDAPTFYSKTSDSALEKVKEIIKNKTYKETSVALSPHMFQTASLKTYQKCKKIANENNLLLSSHISETKSEVDYSLKNYKQRPIEVLNKYGILDNNTILAHCCWLNKNEIRILSESGASAVHCPVSNMKLADGFMPLLEMIKLGVNVGLGTDSPSSNNNLDMFEEMKMTALIHKGNNLDPTIISAQRVLDMATINGAIALNMEKQIGSLEIDKKADIIIIDFEQSHLIPVYNPVSHLIYSARGSDVETVIINGKIIMEDKKIKNINESVVFAWAKKFASF
ncbi:MAG: amidohydrolase [bacterium]